MFNTSSAARGGRATSIEKMLEDVEKEIHGPDYQYMPPSDSSEDGSSVTYTSITKTKVEPAPFRERCHTSPVHLVLPQQSSKFPIPLNPRKKNKGYDNLTPLKKPTDEPVLVNRRTISGRYISLQFSPPPATTAEPGLRTSPDGESPCNHDYEDIPPLEDGEFDSYVYMAPSSDKQAQQLGSDHLKRDHRAVAGSRLEEM